MANERPSCRFHLASVVAFSSLSFLSSPILSTYTLLPLRIVQRSSLFLSPSAATSSLFLSRFTGTSGEPSSPSVRTRTGRLAYSVDLHADLIRVHTHSEPDSFQANSARAKEERIACPFPFHPSPTKIRVAEVRDSRILVARSRYEREDAGDRENRIGCQSNSTHSIRFQNFQIQAVSLPLSLFCFHSTFVSQLPPTCRYRCFRRDFSRQLFNTQNETSWHRTWASSSGPSANVTPLRISFG